MQHIVQQVHDVDELKQRLISVWHSFEQSVGLIDDAVICNASLFTQKQAVKKWTKYKIPDTW